MNNELKQEAVNGLIYRFLERISAQLVSTIVSIILARILLPEDYGIVSLVTIFISICNTFVTDGFGSSLIQKRNADQLDFSTIFWFSLFLSVILYCVIFYSSPLIAKYYQNNLITSVLRAMGLRIPLAAINSVQQAYVSKKLMFKKFFWATLLGTITSGVAGIVMAYCGFGVWSLVAQYLINVTVDTLMLFALVKWIPSLLFSFKRLNNLFPFALKILISGLITTFYDEIRSLIIAKKYSTTDLSYYDKGKQFPQLFGNNISTTITNVMFPVFSKIQDDEVKLKKTLKNSLKVGTYIISPLLLGLYAVANNFVTTIYTEKWAFCIAYVKLFSIMYLFKPLKHISQSAIKAIGKSGTILVLNIVEKIFGIILLFASMKYGVFWIAFSAVLTYFLSAIMDAIVCGKYTNYSIFEQIIDILPNLLLAVIMAICVYAMNIIHINSIILLFIQVLSGGIFYIVCSIVFKLESFVYLVGIFRDKFL